MTSTYLFLQPKPSEVQQSCITQGSPLDKSTVNTKVLEISGESPRISGVYGEY